MITTFDLDEYVHAALKAGARGFLRKDAGPDLLTQAIHAAANGDALIAPGITARLLAAFADTHPTAPAVQPIEPLTAREEEVLIPVAQGWTNHEIADDRHISVSTVKTHLASLMRKLNARNRVEIAMWTYETGRIRSDRTILGAKSRWVAPALDGWWEAADSRATGLFPLANGRRGPAGVLLGLLYARLRRHAMPKSGGIGHIALTVTDVHRSASWYASVFEATSIVRDSTGGHDMDVLAGENLLIGLHKHAHTSPDDRFNEARIGLDHAAVLCEDRAALEEWGDHLDKLGVEHSGIEASSFGAHINFKDPDGIALEVHSP